MAVKKSVNKTDLEARMRRGVIPREDGVSEIDYLSVCLDEFEKADKAKDALSRDRAVNSMAIALKDMPLEDAVAIVDSFCRQSYGNMPEGVRNMWAISYALSKIQELEACFADEFDKKMKPLNADEKKVLRHEAKKDAWSILKFNVRMNQDAIDLLVGAKFDPKANVKFLSQKGEAGIDMVERLMALADEGWYGLNIDDLGNLRELWQELDEYRLKNQAGDGQPNNE